MLGRSEVQYLQKSVTAADRMQNRNPFGDIHHLSPAGWHDDMSASIGSQRRPAKGTQPPSAFVRPLPIRLQPSPRLRRTGRQRLHSGRQVHEVRPSAGPAIGLSYISQVDHEDMFPARRARLRQRRGGGIGPACREPRDWQARHL